MVTAKRISTRRTAAAPRSESTQDSQSAVPQGMESTTASANSYVEVMLLHSHVVIPESGLRMLFSRQLMGTLQQQAVQVAAQAPAARVQARPDQQCPPLLMARICGVDLVHDRG
eukprot:5568143-Amphidinium_carterae.1